MCGHQGSQLLQLHVQQALQVHTTIGELLEHSLLRFCGLLLRHVVWVGGSMMNKRKKDDEVEVVMLLLMMRMEVKQRDEAWFFFCFCLIFWFFRVVGGKSGFSGSDFVVCLFLLCCLLCGLYLLWFVFVVLFVVWLVLFVV
jgi:hypothetical protein